MNKLIMMVGLPGSGKSTKAQELSKEYNAVIHSSDKIREELFGIADVQDDNEFVFQTLHKRIKSDLREDKNVIYDSTNINYKRRMAFLQEIKKIECEKIAILMATPYKDCLENNLKRERKVPEEIIVRMYKNFYIPQYYEGWHDIQIIWNYQDEDFNGEALFEELCAIPQENPYHTLTIGDHCNKCYEILESQNLSCFIDVAGQFHDIGKKFTKEFNEEKNYCTYYQHHLVSAYDTMFYLDKILFESEVLETCAYITWHMQPFFIQTEKAKEKFIKLVGQKFYDNLMILHEADKMAK